ncbi:MAG: 3-deoxy-7-phosphoheptulonate synthase, partial [Candidatus Methylomirabilis sp.]|nr:3-deoxy-7-phosphoheptulonate synthase [Deltaproteobacteria bacterium]
LLALALEGVGGGARRVSGLPLVTEVMDTRQVALVAEHADVLQIGARNAQNFDLLKEVGKTRRPVLLKRGLAMTMKEWLMSAEYVLSEGNPNVILCERGIRTFETMTRNTLDLSTIPVMKEETHLPIIIDPSHGVGFAKWVEPMAFAAIAAGADGVMIEVHPTPAEAWSDGEQALTPQQFSDVMKKLRGFAEVAGREL